MELTILFQWTMNLQAVQTYLLNNLQNRECALSRVYSHFCSASDLTTIQSTKGLCHTTSQCKSDAIYHSDWETYVTLKGRRAIERVTYWHVFVQTWLNAM